MMKLIITYTNNIKNFDKFFFVCFPYDAVNEIHGFDYNVMNQYVGQKINKVARGGFFGGPKKSIEILNPLYYALMDETLSNGFMGTEESLFTILLYNNPTLIDYFEIKRVLYQLLYFPPLYISIVQNFLNLTIY